MEKSSRRSSISKGPKKPSPNKLRRPGWRKPEGGTSATISPPCADGTAARAPGTQTNVQTAIQPADANPARMAAPRPRPAERQLAIVRHLRPTRQRPHHEKLCRTRLGRDAGRGDARLAVVSANIRRPADCRQGLNRPLHERLGRSKRRRGFNSARGRQPCASRCRGARGPNRSSPVRTGPPGASAPRFRQASRRGQCRDRRGRRRQAPWFP